MRRLRACAPDRVFKPGGLRSARLCWDRQQVFFELVYVWVWLQLRFALIKHRKELLVHLSIFEVGISVSGAHHILRKDCLAVFNLPDLVVALAYLLKQLVVAGPCNRVPHLSLEYRLAYLNALSNPGIVRKPSFLDI